MTRAFDLVVRLGFPSNFGCTGYTPLMILNKAETVALYSRGFLKMSWKITSQKLSYCGWIMLFKSLVTNNCKRARSSDGIFPSAFSMELMGKAYQEQNRSQSLPNNFRRSTENIYPDFAHISKQCLFNCLRAFLKSTNEINIHIFSLSNIEWKAKSDIQECKSSGKRNTSIILYQNCKHTNLLV